MRTPSRLISFEYMAISFVFLVFCTVLSKTLAQCNGSFVYSLDDPYIHLALAKQIGLGHYGINPSEFSSPSSSIIWPLLLTPFSRFSFFQYVPLFINFLCLTFSAISLVTLLNSSITLKGNGILARVSVSLVVVWTCLAHNWIGVAFTGMEHSAHILITIALLRVTIESIKTGRIAKSFTFWLAFAPLIRYEAILLSGLASWVVGTTHGRVAWRGTAIGFSGLVAFSGFLKSLGLPILPCSVIAKSNVIAPEGTPILTLLQLKVDEKLQFLIHEVGILPLLILFVTPLVISVFAIKAYQRLLVGTSLVMIAYLIIGSFGWYARYELFLVSWVLVLSAISIASSQHSRSRKSLLGLCLAVVSMCLCLCLSHFAPLRTSHIASSNIYDQQMLSAKIVRNCLKERVAVYDLGAVALFGGEHVIDLWGLGSPKALVARTRTFAGEPVSFLRSQERAEQFKVAIIFDQLLEVPKEWVKVASWKITGPRITVPYERVFCYATSPKDAGRILNKLTSLKDTDTRNRIEFLKLDPAR